MSAKPNKLTFSWISESGERPIHHWFCPFISGNCPPSTPSFWMTTIVPSSSSGEISNSNEVFWSISFLWCGEVSLGFSAVSEKNRGSRKVSTRESSDKNGRSQIGRPRVWLAERKGKYLLFSLLERGKSKSILEEKSPFFTLLMNSVHLLNA